jgi:hypothetical protein
MTCKTVATWIVSGLILFASMRLATWNTTVGCCLAYVTGVIAASVIDANQEGTQ